MARHLSYFVDRGMLLTDGTVGLLIGDGDLAVVFSFELEARAGRDLHEHYRWYGASRGQHGSEIASAAMRVPVDPSWNERLHEVGLAVVSRSDLGKYRSTHYALVLSTEEI